MAASKANEPPAATKNPEDDIPRRTSKKFYKFLRIIGEGSFSNVYYCKDSETNHEVAIKVCDKNHIVKENKIEYIMREKEALNWCNAGQHPFITTLFSTFHDDDRLYFVLSYAPNGDLLNYIRELGQFSVEQAGFYTAEIVSALEYLHHGLPNGCHIVHRDLKPENILIKRDMHIMLCDFGSVKLFDKDMKPLDIKKSSSQPEGGEQRQRDAPGGRPNANMYRAKSFVGTAQYVSPEVLTGKIASSACDLWGLGCIIYQLLTGKWPFHGETEFIIFQRITSLDYSFTDDFPPVAEDLVQKLLIIDPTQRLGVQETGGYDALRSHPFYKEINWVTLAQTTPPPLRRSGADSAAIQTPNTSDVDEDSVPPGFDDTHFQRLLYQSIVAPVMPNGGTIDIVDPGSSLNSLVCHGRRLPIAQHERVARLTAQAKDNSFHKLIDGNLILKQGFLDKRVGLFARRRMFLLTEGPRLFYVDAEKMILKGEIPFSKDMRTETKDFKVFFIHVPNRTYYLIDREGYAMDWVREINHVLGFYFGTN